MNKVVTTKNAKIIISCNEAVNFFIHTLNIYGMLGVQGNQYALRQNEKVRQSIDSEIFEEIIQPQYCTRTGQNFYASDWKPKKRLRIYETGMQYIMDNKIWEKPVDLENVHMGVTEVNFDRALRKSWEKFYRDYWRETLKDREALFEKCANGFDFAEALEKMELATQRIPGDDFYVFPTEATAEAAIWFEPNVSMGTMRRPGHDFGFTHEGLHILLKEEWAKNNKIVKFMEKVDYKGWQFHYEQALVVGLDCCIRNIDSAAKDYHKGCGVDDVFPVSYPLIKEYYDSGCKEDLEEVMFKIISRTIGSRKTVR
ncbi:MAG: hypothetical protein FWE64_03810 [Alphaproteobacteria bacterium]|nr:hypothetical protein [Alphaproteobacteria bacterium]